MSEIKDIDSSIQNLLARVPAAQREAAANLLAQYGPRFFELGQEDAWGYLRRLLAGDLAVVTELDGKLTDAEWLAKVKADTAGWEAVARYNQVRADLKNEFVLRLAPVVASLLLRWWGFEERQGRGERLEVRVGEPPSVGLGASDAKPNLSPLTSNLLGEVDAMTGNNKKGARMMDGNGTKAGAVERVRAWLRGKKTYMTAGIGVLGAVMAWADGQIGGVGLAGAIWAALQACFIRAGLDNAVRQQT